ncbi:thioredoxin family protein [Brassicibacter mesophilus]|uniref:thioredoxin family protein n=1 Tax=Brassicibacter mesophilus TaxID=745119 RepID=UPI003D1C9EC4
MFIKELNSESIYQCVFEESGLVILVFYTAQFEPSNRMLGQLSELYEAYGHNIQMYKVDYQEQAELVKIFEVVSLPTLIMFKNGNEKYRFTGTVTNEQIEIFISMIN